MIRPIAIAGIGCRYPDAKSPDELWENVLAGRRAGQRAPAERLPLEDHGLALDTAGRALEDAGFPDGEGLPKAATAVFVSNSLAGELASPDLIRLRWPYVRRTLGDALKDIGWDDGKLAGFLTGLEARYSGAFPPAGQDAPAGEPDTLAGRICHQFGFQGGGFQVGGLSADGACSSSLMSVVTACSALSDEAIDAAVAGGVDLGPDPAQRRGDGCWPGQGCGLVVLLRAEDAEARGLRSYATIAGWGYSSAGRGNIGPTRAAAGVAGLIKATMAVRHRVISPATGVSDTGSDGINAHVVIDGGDAARRATRTSMEIFGQTERSAAPVTKHRCPL